MTDTIQLDIVSAEESLFSGSVKVVFLPGTQGELGIYPGHTPLLTTLKPGQVRYFDENEDEEIYYISGGMLEVQPNIVTVLADTALRADDIDEAAALEAKKRAQSKLDNKKAKIDYAHAAAELAQAVAQIRAIEKLRKKRR